MTMYDIIYEQIQDRYFNNEITLEDAEILNEAAYTRYVVENKFGDSLRKLGSSAKDKLKKFNRSSSEYFDDEYADYQNRAKKNASMNDDGERSSTFGLKPLGDAKVRAYDNRPKRISRTEVDTGYSKNDYINDKAGLEIRRKPHINNITVKHNIKPKKENIV